MQYKNLTIDMTLTSRHKKKKKCIKKIMLIYHALNVN